MSLFKLIFIVFPSNAEVERGFAVNKECVVGNLLNDSLVAQRAVYDAMKKDFNLDVRSLEINPSLRQYFKNAGSKRNEFLKLKKKGEEGTKNGKRRIDQEILVLKAKKKQN